MSEEDVSEWLVRYRSTVTEEPTSPLDRAILRAAGRHAVRVRTMRRSAVIVGLALVTLAIWPFWRAHTVRAPQASNVGGYGREEGVTRYYLLNVATVRHTGPGSTEGRP